MEKWIELFPNSFVGFTPLVTYQDHERAIGIRECVKHIPLDKLLIETDAPYFLPREIRPIINHNISLPPFCITVAEEIAKLRGEKLTPILQEIRRNTIEMYGIEF